MKLFCIPYAGGTTSFFNSWKPYFDSNIEVIPIELAGKGKRINDPLYQDMDEAVQDVFDLIKEEIEDTPYLIFGHSMGSKIAYKLTQTIQEHSLNHPLHVFLSGSAAPHFKRKNEKIYHLMEDEVFKTEVIELGGTPPEFFEYPELVELFLPALKNDFKIIETASYEEEIVTVNCDLSVFIGKEDDLTPAERTGWKHYTQQRCNFHYFEGGHFFLLDEAEKITHIINQVIMNNAILK